MPMTHLAGQLPDQPGARPRAPRSRVGRSALLYSLLPLFRCHLRCLHSATDLFNANDTHLAGQLPDQPQAWPHAPLKLRRWQHAALQPSQRWPPACVLAPSPVEASLGLGSAHTRIVTEAEMRLRIHSADTCIKWQSCSTTVLHMAIRFLARPASRQSFSWAGFCTQGPGP